MSPVLSPLSSRPPRVYNLPILPPQCSLLELHTRTLIHFHSLADHRTVSGKCDAKGTARLPKTSKPLQMRQHRSVKPVNLCTSFRSCRRRREMPVYLNLPCQRTQSFFHRHYDPVHHLLRWHIVCDPSQIPQSSGYGHCKTSCMPVAKSGRAARVKAGSVAARNACSAWPLRVGGGAALDVRSASWSHDPSMHLIYYPSGLFIIRYAHLILIILSFFPAFFFPFFFFAVSPVVF